MFPLFFFFFGIEANIILYRKGSDFWVGQGQWVSYRATDIVEKIQTPAHSDEFPFLPCFGTQTFNDSAVGILTCQSKILKLIYWNFSFKYLEYWAK